MSSVYFGFVVNDEILLHNGREIMVDFPPMIDCHNLKIYWEKVN